MKTGVYDEDFLRSWKSLKGFSHEVKVEGIVSLLVLPLLFYLSFLLDRESLDFKVPSKIGILAAFLIIYGAITLRFLRTNLLSSALKGMKRKGAVVASVRISKWSAMFLCLSSILAGLQFILYKNIYLALVYETALIIGFLLCIPNFKYYENLLLALKYSDFVCYLKKNGGRGGI